MTPACCHTFADSWPDRLHTHPCLVGRHERKKGGARDQREIIIKYVQLVSRWQENIYHLNRLIVYKNKGAYNGSKNMFPESLCKHTREVWAWCTPCLASHTLHREEGSGHVATFELLPQQKLAVTNEIRTLCRSHPLSWISITSQHV